MIKHIKRMLFAPVFWLTYSAAVAGGSLADLKPASDSEFRDGRSADPASVALGKMLFFDKILSGNLNISCATCHHPFAGTGDGLSLPVGEGALGFGVTRDTGHGTGAIRERVPRNAPAIFNLGAREFTRMFHDGRVEEDPSQMSGFRSPAGDQLPEGLENVLAVQAMFPVTSGTEMAGQAGENDQADAAAANLLAGPEGVWELIAAKLRAIPGYTQPFMDAFPGEIVGSGDITFVHAANAIAAFEASAWRFDDSPFDRYLRGDHRALSPEARAGMKLFYGKAGCSECHAGTFQTDHGFHAIAMPQIGPGKGHDQPGWSDGLDDLGRGAVTGITADDFRFRTPSLRNVALTAPYGHAGAYGTLEAVVRHHLDPVAALLSYETGQAVMPRREDLDALDFRVMEDPLRVSGIASANELAPSILTDKDVRELTAFLHALTDPAALDLRTDVPESVPSGLPVRD